MKRLKRLFAKLFIVFTTFLVVLSPIVIVEEGHHHCDHEDCQICEVIRTAEETVKHTFKFSTGAAVSLLIAISFVFVACLLANSKESSFNTPVSLKTKLSN